MVTQPFLVGRAAQIVVAIAVAGGAGTRLHAAPAEKPIVQIAATGDASFNGAVLEAAVTNAANAGKILQLEAGIYRITSSLYLLPGTELVGTNETVDVDGDNVPDELSSNVFVRPQTETVIDGSAIVSNPIPNYYVDCLSPPHVWPLPALGPVIAAGRQNRLARLTVQGAANLSHILVAFGFDNALAIDGGWHTTIEDSVLRDGGSSFFANAGCGAVGFTSRLEFTRNVVHQQGIGLGLINFVTANPLGEGSTLDATLRHNRFRGTFAAIFQSGGRGDAENSETIVESIGNVFENNFFGYAMDGGDFLNFSLAPTNLDQLSRGNSAWLTSNGDTFRANETGVYVVGGNMGGFVVPDASQLSNNLERANLIGTTFADNVVDDIRIYGGVGMTEDNIAQLLLRHPMGGGKLTIAHSTDTSWMNTAIVVGNPNSWAATTGWPSPPEEFFSSGKF